MCKRVFRSTQLLLWKIKSSNTEHIVAFTRCLDHRSRGEIKAVVIYPISLPLPHVEMPGDFLLANVLEKHKLQE